jgi:8-oxo-dGTP pyrophosphatase MutT (NUDIX family)
MLRDSRRGPEVLLIKRHTLSDVLGDAYPFAGGKLDSQDANLVSRLDHPLVNLHALLGEPQLTHAEAGALNVCAIREVFEERVIRSSRHRKRDVPQAVRHPFLCGGPPA